MGFRVWIFEVFMCFMVLESLRRGYRGCVRTFPRKTNKGA